MHIACQQNENKSKTKCCGQLLHFAVGLMNLVHMYVLGDEFENVLCIHITPEYVRACLEVRKFFGGSNMEMG